MLFVWVPDTIIELLAYCRLLLLAHRCLGDLLCVHLCNETLDVVQKFMLNNEVEVVSLLLPILLVQISQLATLKLLISSLATVKSFGEVLDHRGVQFPLLLSLLGSSVLSFFRLLFDLADCMNAEVQLSLFQQARVDRSIASLSMSL